jgi:hypothetical protein
MCLTGQMLMMAVEDENIILLLNTHAELAASKFKNFIKAIEEA